MQNRNCYPRSQGTPTSSGRFTKASFNGASECYTRIKTQCATAKAALSVLLKAINNPRAIKVAKEAKALMPLRREQPLRPARLAARNPSV